MNPEVAFEDGDARLSGAMNTTTSLIVTTASFLAIVGLAAAQTEPKPKTRLVILGVSHSQQLVAESYQPAVFRAFFDRVKADAIGIERSPDELARNDHYEFTYEI